MILENVSNILAADLKPVMDYLLQVRSGFLVSLRVYPETTPFNGRLAKSEGCLCGGSQSPGTWLARRQKPQYSQSPRYTGVQMDCVYDLGLA